MHLRCWTTRIALTAALLLLTGTAAPVCGDDPAWSEKAGLEFWSGNGQLPQPPHLVIRAPTQPPSQATARRAGMAHGMPAGSHHSPPAPVVSEHVVAGQGEAAHITGPHGDSRGHETHRRGHWWQKPAPPTIPGAVVAPVWRSPYSYGYFGAGRHRHWQRHYGARQSYHQWTLK